MNSAKLAGALLLALFFSNSAGKAGVAPVAAMAAAQQELGRHAEPLGDGDGGLDEQLAAMRGAQFVLVGENTHGTGEFYRERGLLSDRLVRELGFRAIAVEADWTPAFRVNLYVRGLGRDASAREALSSFTNFPRWMWRNVEVAEFVERLRTYNLALPPERRIGFYGIDVYDLYPAIDAVLKHLGAIDPFAARRASASYRCFTRLGRSSESYGIASRHRSCEKEAKAALAEVERLARPVDGESAEQHFYALGAARSVVAAEEYYHASYAGTMSWNKRDTSMARNAELIAAHMAADAGASGKVVIWAHNSHVGDARATDAPNRGELNLGQLMRQKHGSAAYLVGLFTHSGTVRATDEWGREGRIYDLRAAGADTYSHLFHGTGLAAFSLVLRGNERVKALLDPPRYERAIGVIYRRGDERSSHYVPTHLPAQFDGIIFFDKSEAVRPL